MCQRRGGRVDETREDAEDVAAWREVSVRDLASEISVSAATVCRIEQGYEMDARTFLKIMQWLGSKDEEASR